MGLMKRGGLWAELKTKQKRQRNAKNGWHRRSWRPATGARGREIGSQLSHRQGVMSYAREFSSQGLLTNVIHRQLQVLPVAVVASRTNRASVVRLSHTSARKIVARPRAAP